jgi:hypothetical protein
VKITTRTITTIIGGGALILATAGIGVAQEATPDPATQTQAQRLDENGRAQGVQNQTGSARRLGPGDGTGNQGVKPADGSGNGSPGRMGAGSTVEQGNATASTNSKAAQKATKKAAKQADKTAARNGGNGAGGNGSRTRSQARDLSGSGSGSCAGTASGSQRRAGGSGGGARR